MIGPDQDWVDEQRNAAKQERRRLHAQWHRTHGIPCSGVAGDPYCVAAEAWAVAELRRGPSHGEKR